MRQYTSLLSIMLLAATTMAQANVQINVVGLFNNKAVVIINNGKPKTLTAGQTLDGVKLISADSKMATFEVEGKTKQLGMGQAASIGGGNASGTQSVTLYANQEGHFVGECAINGAPLKFLVDTGATTVTLNSGDAKFAKIDYKRGEPIMMSTANGLVTAYKVSLASLKIGGVTLSQVEASVIEGGSPPIVLMGMTALNRLDMKRQDIAMTLTKKY